MCVQTAIVRALVVAVALSAALPAQVEAQASPAAPADGAADEQEARARAKTLFESGVAAYEAGRYEEALASFQEAFRVRPHPLVRVNIANCYDKLGKPLEALFHFEQFTAADVGSAEQRKEVAAAVERLRKQVGQVVVRVAPDGAMVTIDGGEQRRTPIVDALQLTEGKHELEVKLDGYQTVRRSLEVQGGTTTELTVVLPRAGEPTPAAAAPVPAPGEQPQVAAPPAAEPEPPAPAAPAPLAQAETPPEPAAEGSAALPTSFWVVGGVSAALLLAGSVTGMLALDAESDFDQAARVHLDPNSSGLSRQTAYQQALDASDRADGLALTTDILLLGALAGTAVCVVIALNARSDDDGEPSSTATLTPAVSPNVLGARFAASF